MELQTLEVGVPSGFGCDLGDVQLVADVAIQPEAFVVQCANRLACELQRNRNVAQPFAGFRLRDDGALVTHERIVESGVECVGSHRPEHAAGHEDDVNACFADALEDRARTSMKRRVLADQRPVEVARHCCDVAREVRRKLQLFFVRKLTSAVS